MLRMEKELFISAVKGSFFTGLFDNASTYVKHR